MNLTFYLKELKVYIAYKLKRPIPCAVTLRTTYRCNLKCSFCSFWKHKIFRNNDRELSTRQIFALIDDLHKIGVPYITVTGGEPLLREDIEGIGLYLRNKKITSGLCTNGTLITKDKAKNLSKAFDFIRISFDGFGEVHNKIRGVDKAYEMAFEGLNNILNAENRTARVGIHFVITDRNKGELNKLIENFKDKVDTISVLPVFYYNQNKIGVTKKTLSVWREMQKKLEKYGLCEQTHEFLKNPSFENGKKYCDAGKLYYAFTPSGEVWSCSFRPYTVGNINKEPFYQIWKRGLNDDVKNRIKNCQGCYVRGTTEMSMVFRKSPWTMLKDAVKILKAYRY